VDCLFADRRLTGVHSSKSVVSFVLADDSFCCWVRVLGSGMADWNYAGSDFYCDIAIPRAGELDAVYWDELVLAHHHHTRPFWLTRIVVMAKRHLASLISPAVGDEPDFRALFAAVQLVARR
jgi:hypothetical protein